MSDRVPADFEREALLLDIEAVRKAVGLERFALFGHLNGCIPAIQYAAAYPERVYNEAAGLTLSVWYPTGAQIELEPIGPRERLKPGESASFTEEWWLLSHPFPKKGQRLDLKALAQQVEKQTGKPK